MKKTSKANDKVNPHQLIRTSWLEWIARKAGKNLGKWGVQDFETLGLAICEEAGELAQAILQNKHENGERRRITHEALDLAALCVQVMVTMQERHGFENLMNALHLCPHCLRPCGSKASLRSHIAACPKRGPKNVICASTERKI